MNNPKFVEDQLIQTLQRAERLAKNLQDTIHNQPGSRLDRKSQMTTARVRIEGQIAALKIALNKI